MLERDPSESLPSTGTATRRALGRAASSEQTPDIAAQFGTMTNQLAEALDEAFSWTRQAAVDMVAAVREQQMFTETQLEALERLQRMSTLANLRADAASEWQHWYTGAEDLDVRRFSTSDIMRVLPEVTSATTVEQLQLHILRILDKLARLVY